MADSKQVSVKFGFPLQTILLILKLAKVVTWPWWIILLPIEIPFGILLGVGLFMFACWVIVLVLDWRMNVASEKARKQRRVQVNKRKNDPLNPF
jgi:hypothetical protein